MKILAVIENDTYVRNFIISGAFDKLLPQKNFNFAVSNIASKLISQVPREKITGTYTRNEHNKKLVYVFNQISMMALRQKSSTFDIKIKAYPLKFKDFIIYNLYSNPIFFDWARKNILTRFKKNYSLEKIINKFRPDIVMFPFTGVESTGNELIILSKKYKFKTFFLVNGWDNLSSKGVFLLTPDFLGVWGPKDYADAINIQNMPAFRTIMLGCSRYESYFSKKTSKKSPFGFKYILFAGATTANDEITPLKIFDRFLEKTGNREVKIVYRPHPWREKRYCFDLFDQNDYKHVVIDPQVAQDYYRNKKENLESGSSQNFPELNYYPGLLNNAMFVISPTSSILLEAAILNVPSLVLAQDDGYNPIPPAAQAMYKHFEGTQEIPGWFFARDYDEIEKTFGKLFKKFFNETPKNREYRPVLSEVIKKYLFYDNNTYAQRLKNILDVINSQVTNE